MLLVAFLFGAKPRSHRVSPAVFSRSKKTQIEFVLFWFCSLVFMVFDFFGLCLVFFFSNKTVNNPKFPKLRTSILTAPIAEANDFVLSENPWKPSLTSFSSRRPRKPSIARALESDI